MNAVDTIRQQEIIKYREDARILLDEAAWIQRALPNLPYLKRVSAIKAIFILKNQAHLALEKAVSLEIEF